MSSSSPTLIEMPTAATRAVALQQLRWKRSQRTRFLDDDAEEDPLSGLANLFDAAIVFAVALMVALVSYMQVPALLANQNYTIITNPGTPDMEIVVKDGQEIKHYEASDAQGAGQGQLLGQAYRLPDGRVIYVPAE